MSADGTKPLEHARYQVHPESITGHGCCFHASVLDTADTTGGGIIRPRALCECADAVTANMIANALNEAHKAKAH